MHIIAGGITDGAHHFHRQPFQYRCLRHQFAYGLISAAIPGTHMGIEGNDCLSAEIILVKTSGEDATHMRNTFPCLELSICFQFWMLFRLLVQLRSCRNTIIQHQQIQSFVSVVLVHRTDQHSLGVDTHHLPGRQICNRHTGLSDQLFRLLILVNSA